LVTGHTGFKGSWLCALLHRLGAEVTGLALEPPTEPSLYVLADLGGLVTADIRGDVRDRELVERVLVRSDPEIVIHMAAQPLVLDSYAAPVETYEVNVLGTVHVLEAVRRSACTGGSVRAVVNVTTDKVYDNRGWVWGYRETDELGGRDPYSNSKACSEMVTAAYRASYFSEPGAPLVATARAGNVIGGGDFAGNRLLPDLLRAFSEGRPCTIRRPRSVRPWQHVLEALSGYLALAERLLEGDASCAASWNFGPHPDDVLDVASVADLAAKKWGGGASWTPGEAEDGHHEEATLSLDSARAASVLGWSPRTRAGDAIGMAVEWELSRVRGENALASTLTTVDQYLRIPRP